MVTAPYQAPTTRQIDVLISNSAKRKAVQVRALWPDGTSPYGSGAGWAVAVDRRGGLRTWQPLTIPFSARSSAQYLETIDSELASQCGFRKVKR
jgi:hypothetical protein